MLPKFFSEEVVYFYQEYWNRPLYWLQSLTWGNKRIWSKQSVPLGGIIKSYPTVYKPSPKIPKEILHGWAVVVLIYSIFQGPRLPFTACWLVVFPRQIHSVSKGSSFSPFSAVRWHAASLSIPCFSCKERLPWSIASQRGQEGGEK